MLSHFVEITLRQRSNRALTLFPEKGIKKWIFPLLFSVVISSCSPVVRLLYGVRSPIPVTYEEICRFQAGQLSNEALLCFLPLDADPEYAVPEPFLFDKSGRAIDFKSNGNSNCTGSLGTFLSKLNARDVRLLSSHQDLDAFAHPLSKSPCQKEAILIQQADYHLFITWATWTGKTVYRQRVQDWIRGAQANKQLRIAVYLVNMDPVRCD